MTASDGDDAGSPYSTTEMTVIISVAVSRRAESVLSSYPSGTATKRRTL